MTHKIRYPEVARENGMKGKVYVSFVISKKEELKM
ncbi:MAG: energy transducer TonB [Prolixibacteraceae bacterium]|nr:energy transducer TonB [Prolixibacteraceae bacterium]